MTRLFKHWLIFSSLPPLLLHSTSLFEAFFVRRVIHHSRRWNCIFKTASQPQGFLTLYLCLNFSARRSSLGGRRKTSSARRDEDFKLPARTHAHKRWPDIGLFRSSSFPPDLCLSSSLLISCFIFILSAVFKFLLPCPFLFSTLAFSRNFSEWTRTKIFSVAHVSAWLVFVCICLSFFLSGVGASCQLDDEKHICSELKTWKLNVTKIHNDLSFFLCSFQVNPIWIPDFPSFSLLFFSFFLSLFIPASCWI